MNIFKRNDFEKVKYTVYNEDRKRDITLVAKINDDIQKDNIERICKEFQYLISEIRHLKGEVLDLKIINAVKDYKDIYEYIDKNNEFKHFIIASDDTVNEKIMVKLLEKTFGNVYKDGFWFPPVCLSKVIEDCEQKLKEQNVDQPTDL